jgi:electron transport complex protein RnfD
MLDVIIALLPTTAVGIWMFGMSAVWLIATCIVTCIVTEAVCRIMMRRENTIGDLSAIVTGLLLALNLPAGLPLWMAIVGSVFAIVVCKQVFGGIGMNPFNPALAARAFMLISFTGPMTTWLRPKACVDGCCQAMCSATSAGADAVTCATPLAFIKSGDLSALPSLWHLAIGNIPGCIGEVSAVALALGGLYLLWRKVITWHIPVSFLLTVAIYALISGRAPAHVEILTGGIMIGAVFMATDYVSSPTTGKGKLIFGFGCGLLCMLIRQFGSYPEGCSFAILIMNALCPLINRWTQPKPFGAKK